MLTLNVSVKECDVGSDCGLVPRCPASLGYPRVPTVLPISAGSCRRRSHSRGGAERQRASDACASSAVDCGPLLVDGQRDLSQPSHRLARRSRTRAVSLEELCTLTCGNGFTDTVRTVGSGLRIRRLGVRIPPSALRVTDKTVPATVLSMLPGSDIGQWVVAWRGSGPLDLSDAVSGCRGWPGGLKVIGSGAGSFARVSRQGGSRAGWSGAVVPATRFGSCRRW